MEQLGVRNLSSEASADLSGISNEHLQVFQVNGERTEAAAANAVGILSRSCPHEFIAARPFFFIVNDFEHKATLFAGKLVDQNILWLGSSRR